MANRFGTAVFTAAGHNVSFALPGRSCSDSLVDSGLVSSYVRFLGKRLESGVHVQAAIDQLETALGSKSCVAGKEGLTFILYRLMAIVRSRNKSIP
jgi:hypothetical protein